MRAYEVANKAQLRILEDGYSEEKLRELIAAVKTSVCYEEALPIAARPMYGNTWRRLGWEVNGHRFSKRKASRWLINRLL